MTELTLHLRSTDGLLYSGAVLRVLAEDVDGWFGILPGRSDMLSVLVPGLLIFEDEKGRGYAALVGGLLDLKAGTCRVMSREAVISRDIAQLSALLAQQRSTVLLAADRQRDVVDDLAREAFVRIARGSRT